MLDKIFKTPAEEKPQGAPAPAYTLILNASELETHPRALSEATVAFREERLEPVYEFNRFNDCVITGFFPAPGEERKKSVIAAGRTSLTHAGQKMLNDAVKVKSLRARIEALVCAASSPTDGGVYRHIRFLQDQRGHFLLTYQHGFFNGRDADMQYGDCFEKYDGLGRIIKPPSKSPECCPSVIPI